MDAAQQGLIAQVQAREADVVALAELACALDKMEVLLIELRCMSEEVSRNEKDGCGLPSDLDDFRKQYAMVLTQLKDVNDQVASSLLYLKERNTLPGSLMPSWQRPVENFDGTAMYQAGLNGSTTLGQDSRFNAMEIIGSSTKKARIIVEGVCQATRSLKEGEDAFNKIGEALGLISDKISSSKPAPPDSVNENCTRQGSIPNDVNEMQFPLDLITNCVATLFTIQDCAERQEYQPAQVVRLLDSALASLRPRSQQNMPVYREIETCFGIIKNQLLALVPTTDSAENSTS